MEGATAGRDEFGVAVLMAADDRGHGVKGSKVSYRFLFSFAQGLAKGIAVPIKKCLVQVRSAGPPETEPSRPPASWWQRCRGIHGQQHSDAAVVASSQSAAARRLRTTTMRA